MFRKHYGTGLTNRDKELVLLKIEHVIEKKQRSRKKFPTLEEFQQTVLESMVENNVRWISVDKVTKEK